MKKLISLLLALAMCLSLAACGGGPDKQPAIDAFNNTSKTFNDFAAAVNEDIESYPDEFITIMTDMANLLNEYEALLSGDTDLSEEQLSEMIAWFGTVDEWVAETKTELEAMAADSAATAPADGAEITQEQLEALTAAYNTVAPLYNEAYIQAEANGWLNDATTAAEIEAMSSTLGVIGTALTEDLTMLNGSDFDGLTSTLLQLEAPLNELIERVSASYGG